MQSARDNPSPERFNLQTEKGDTIFLHYADLDQITKNHGDTLRRIVIPEEQSRATLFKESLLQKRFLASRWFLRMVLSGYTREFPSEIQLSITDLGKPYLVDHPLFFNLSHSENFMVIGVTEAGEIGVDVELCRNPETAGEVSSAIMSGNEVAQWHRLPAGERLPVFIRHWILKEAILKAAGTGLSINAKTIELADTGFRPCIKSLSMDLGDIAQWQVGVLNERGHWPAVAWALYKS